ncbi:E3 ubiquitin-protein ligase MPSR1 [Linum perenne]
MRLLMIISESEERMVPTAVTAIGKLLTAVEVGELEDENCVICLEDLGGGETKAAAMPCRHRFHKGCIVNWLKQPLLSDLSIRDADGGEDD